MGNYTFLLKKGKAFIIIVACSLLLLTSIYQQIANKQSILSILQQGDPAAVNFNEVNGVYKTYELMDAKGNFLSYGVISSASGYGGPITMLTTVSREGRIVNAVILENTETPLYLKKVRGFGYPENLKGKKITQPLNNYEDIDAVSGATRTTTGIKLAVEKGIYQVGQNQLGLTVPSQKHIHFQWQDGLVVLLFVVAMAASVRNMRRLRIWLLVSSVVILGFVTNSSLTIGNFISILALKIPTFFERPVWYLMVLGVLVVTLILGNNFYCTWLCPFGAVQEGIYKALNLINYVPNPRLISIAQKSRWLFLWLAAMLALLFNNPGIASYEPFSVFFDGDGSTSQWIIMGIILLSSIFILRFWCRCFCPVGACLNTLASCKQRGKKLFRNKFISKESSEIPTSLISISGCCQDCTSSKKEKPKVSPLSSSDKLVAGVIVVICFLIVGALFQSIWMS
ncbi:FMN-binding protein [Desulfosporosinus hippei]|nr:4Fe-4S binding protein [Desulfosporosinus hippei]